MSENRVLWRIAGGLSLAILSTPPVEGAEVHLFNQRIPREAISGIGPQDAISGRCFPNIEGWMQTTGDVYPGDGIRHTVVGRCLDDGTVLILEDHIPDCGTEAQCDQLKAGQ